MCGERRAVGAVRAVCFGQRPDPLGVGADERCAVAGTHTGLVQFIETRGKLRGGHRAVVKQALGRAVPDAKRGAVHLATPRVERRGNDPIAGLRESQCLERRDAHAGCVMYKRQTFERCETDAQAGETARPGGSRKHVHVGGRDLSRPERLITQGKKRFAVRQAAAQRRMVHHASVLQDANARRLRCGIQCKNGHSAPPSTVMRRSLSPVRTMSTRTASSPARMSAAFSLHSAATM